LGAGQGAVFIAMDLKGFFLGRGYAGQLNYPMKTLLALFGILLLAGPVFAADTPVPQTPKKHFKIIQTARATYPVRMMNEGVSTGLVRVVLHVDAEGKLVDWLFVSYSNKAFAEEVERTIKKWTFEPELDNGEPIATIVDLVFNFEVNGVLLVQRFGFEQPIPEFMREFEYQACSLKNIDRIPTPVTIVNPTYPKEWADQGITGKVVVDFYIDETGKVRLPASISSANSMLAGIAVAAVSKWQFTPPTRKGKPVLVHAQQIFEFHKEVLAEK
jgi:TonB family protein